MSAIPGRINTIILLLVLLALVAVVGMLATGARGGPLDPPGPVASTDGVSRPGTPISSLSFTASQPGYYYLTRNLTSGGGNGITITVSNVTIDLNGFVLDGNGRLGGTGILATSGTKEHLSVRNGTITGWNGGGIALDEAVFSRFADLTLSNNHLQGLRAGSGSMIERVSTHHNDSEGIYVAQVGINTGGYVIDSVANLNGASGIRIDASQMLVARNTSNGNGQDAAVSGSGILIRGNDNRVRDNLTDYNDTGIRVESALSGNEFAWNHSEHNGLLDCRDATGSITGAAAPPNDWGQTVQYLSALETTNPLYRPSVFMNICGTHGT